MDIAKILSLIETASQILTAGAGLVNTVSTAVADAKGVASANDLAALEAKLADLKAASATLHQQIQSA